MTEKDFQEAKSETRSLRRLFIHTKKDCEPSNRANTVQHPCRTDTFGPVWVSVYDEKTKQGQLWLPPVVATVTACPGCSHPQHGGAPAKAGSGHVPCDPESSGTASGAVGASVKDAGRPNSGSQPARRPASPGPGNVRVCIHAGQAGAEFLP